MDKDAWIAVAIAVAFVAFVTASILWLAQWQCVERAAFMKLRHQWGPVVGCMVEIEPGKWVPISGLRWL